MFWRHSKKSIGFIVTFLFVMTGTYNAVVINSESDISSESVRFTKRLDEVYGVVTPGRMVAASTTWKKLNQEELKSNPIVQVVSKLDSAPLKRPEIVKEEAAPAAAAAVQEELELSLMEVINPKKWQQGLPAGQFSGNLSTNNGTIESLNVSLPNGEGISVSFSEMTGNVFEYDLDGEVYSGMMYQVDQTSYMVTLTNGPLEGTRLRFGQGNSEVQQQEVQQELAQNYQVEAGSFGSEPAQVSPEAITDYDQAIQQQAMQAQSFNLEQTVQ